MGYNTQEFKKEKKDDYVNKNFLLVSLEEKKAKKIAEVINNDTSRKIIDRLAVKDATESELSKELNIPISTVHYNLKQLQDAGLVVVEEFHYSKKGKEVNHYMLANKYIIIAPKNENPRFLEALKNIMPITIITAGVAFVMQLYSQLMTKTSYATSASLMMEQTADTANVEAAGAMMKAAPIAEEITRPAMQSSPAAYFLIGALAVIIIYFIYEWTKKK
jgi:DNA-binding transcriptional ArsR family regulator